MELCPNFLTISVACDKRQPFVCYQELMKKITFMTFLSSHLNFNTLVKEFEVRNRLFKHEFLKNNLKIQVNFMWYIFLITINEFCRNTSLAAPGTLAHRLQRRTACKIQHGRQEAPKWTT